MPTGFVVRERVPSFRFDLLVASPPPPQAGIANSANKVTVDVRTPLRNSVVAKSV
jgi:hypothetical protein